MKNKFTKMILACAIAVLTGSSVFAMTATEILNKLDSIKLSVDDMKQEYENILTTYPDVIESLSDTNKATLKDLTNNLMASDIKTKVDAAKTELASSTVPNANKVLEAIDNIQNKAEALLEENRDAVEDMKSSYKDLGVEDSKEIIKKVTEITKSLGVEADTAGTYNSMMSILNDVHQKALDINASIKDILQNNEDAIENSLTLDNIEDIFEAIKTKSQENVIDAIINAIDGTDGTEKLKDNLKDIKSQVKELKSKLEEIQNLDEEAILLFSDSEKQGIADKIAIIERDYIDFSKEIINSYATQYLDILVERSHEVSVDKMIETSNELLDYYDEYKSTIEELKSGNFASLNLTDSQKDLAKKAGILVAMDFVDINKYNKDYVNNNFKSEIDMLKDYVIDTASEYLDYIDSTLKSEIDNSIKTNKPNIAQINIKSINMNRFNTLLNIDKLKERVKGYIGDRQNVKSDLDRAANLVYDMYYNNILDTIEKIMLLEKEKQDKQYEFDSLYYRIVASNFISLEDMANMLGIPSDKMSIISSENLANGKFKTGSTFTIKLTDAIYQKYTNIVLGDVYADGIIDARDYMAIKNYIMGKDSLNAIKLLAANTYRDGSVNAQDYMKIKNQIMEKDTISL